MGTGWRRAFCTSIRRDPETASPVEPQPGASPSPSPRSCTRLRFFGKSSSTPSTPRLLQQQQQPPSLPSTPTLRCRTKSAAGTGAVSADVLDDSPKLQCKTSVAMLAKTEAAAPGSCGRSTRLPFVSPNPPSPRSPSRFALLRNNLRLSRSSCGICLQSVKAKQGTAIFTAECSHVFHFHCIAASVRKQGTLVCPVCRAAWRQVPLLSDISAHRHPWNTASVLDEAEQENPKRKPSADPKQGKLSGAGDDGLYNKKGGRVYNDDEPLLHPAACRPGRFNPIPEAEDEQQEEDKGEEDFRGFFSLDPSPVSSPRCAAARRHQLGGVQVTVLPTVALLSSGRSHENYVVALKVKAPSSAMPRPTAAGADGSGTAPSPILEPSRRAPIDLVTVLDVGGSMTSAKLHMMKRAMRLVIASLGPADRLSIVAFSSSSKRLLPLRRMSPEGQRAARRIVDRLLCGDGSCAGEALRKAVKVLEDRRERNPVASIMLLSDAQQQQQGDPHHAASPRNASGGLRGPTTHSDVPFSPNTRFAHLEIPVQASGIGAGHRHEDAEDVFARCVGGLLSVVLQDARLEFTFPSGEVCSVYACGGRPAALGSGADPLRLGDMYADEERELLVELRMPCPRRGGGPDQDHLLPLSVRCAYRDPSTQELVLGREQRLLVPFTRHHAPAAAPKVDRLRNLFVTTRSVAEARRLADHGDFATGIHLLSSARRLLLQSCSISVEEDLRAVEAELEALHCRRQQMRRSEAPETPTFSALDDGAGTDALTPTSAWRAAERLAKVAIMRKSMNRVSDLHGFENARF
ncbi:hypothetical protein Taro_023458 [Colocasia esculenta]|uniref:Uncharacterized protein n=1 Tax=Colocasia esculenta TaxID=4460 RepID=A0A843V8D6_COLES|nr:hypothetical protein [Colocasia esculenta]